jgi:hypothetical protein
MYRKNTASQYIYFCLVNATTGAALTGATVTAYRALDNGSQAAATGTTTELANGQYRFNLSQADTNAENGSYLFVATSAVPVEKTVVFTSANPSDATAFGLSRLDADVTSRMASYTQPTGFLAATFPATVSSYAGGAVASVTAGVTLDSSERNTLVDLVWDEAMSGHTTSGTYGGRIVRATDTNVEVQITGSHHIAADVHEFQAGVIAAGAFAANSITASALATDAVAEIQSGLATSAALAAAKTILDKVDTGLVVDGAVYQFTANMLELGPSGGGGGGDATLAKQEEILAALQGVEAIQVASPNVQGNLVLTQGDDYDGVANPRAQWTVTTDYTTGWTVRLTIRDADDAVVYTNTGSVVSSTVVAVTIAAPTGLEMTGCPGQWQGKFDVELTHSSGKKKTIALGTCYINEDQTR